jgi:hypothetical protein
MFFLHMQEKQTWKNQGLENQPAMRRGERTRRPPETPPFPRDHNAVVFAVRRINNGWRGAITFPSQHGGEWLLQANKVKHGINEGRILSPNTDWRWEGKAKGPWERVAGNSVLKALVGDFSSSRKGSGNLLVK